MFKKNSIKKAAKQIAKNIPVQYCDLCKKRTSRCSCFKKKALSMFLLICLSIWLMSCKAPVEESKVVMFTVEFTYDGSDVDGVMSGNFPEYIAKDIVVIQKKLQDYYDLIKMENQIFDMGRTSK